MSQERLHIALFYHSLLSDWNHGNAHFLRGVVAELQARGHTVDVYEPDDAWSRVNLVAEYGSGALDAFHAAYPGQSSVLYSLETLDLDRMLDGVDLVIVHEWNEPALVRLLGQHRAAHPGYQLLFHDTHHRAVTNPAAMERYDLQHYDGVLAFGRVLADLYKANGWTRRVWTWHEAADVRRFYPSPGWTAALDGDLVWIGNWGDEERTAELGEFLLDPVRLLGLRATVYGVRYPAHARSALAAAGITYGGWLPNPEVPGVFARYGVTVHIPRCPYVRALPGIPTIRVFEALASGIPLVCAPWEDAEGLFSPGEDYLLAGDGTRMRQLLQDVLADAGLAAALSAHGLATIRARHTCAHRVDELMAILEGLRGKPPALVSAEGAA